MSAAIRRSQPRPTGAWLAEVRKAAFATHRQAEAKERSMDGRAVRIGTVYKIPGGRRAVPINEEITLLVPDDADAADAVADFLRAIVQMAASDE